LSLALLGKILGVHDAREDVGALSLGQMRAHLLWARTATRSWFTMGRTGAEASA
jgi:uncharacterized RDD family membrane protein YckC